jgi:hypothetical protein
MPGGNGRVDAAAASTLRSAVPRKARGQRSSEVPPWRPDESEDITNLRRALEFSAEADPHDPGAGCTTGRTLADKIDAAEEGRGQMPRATWQNVFQLLTTGFAPSEVMRLFKLRPHRYKQIIRSKHFREAFRLDSSMARRLARHEGTFSTVRAMKALRQLLVDEQSNCETRRKSAGMILKVGGVWPDRRRKPNGRVCSRSAGCTPSSPANGAATAANAAAVAPESLHSFAFLCGEATGAIGGNSLGQEVITAYSGSFGDAKIRVVAMPTARREPEVAGDGIRLSLVAAGRGWRGA